MKILAHTVAVVDLEYSFDAEAEEEHNRRMDAWTILAEGDKEWQITSEQFNSNTKAHAGANRSINRIPWQNASGHGTITLLTEHSLFRS